MKANWDDKAPLKERIGRIIFRTDTPKAKAFDAFLLVAILLSVLLVILETIGPLKEAYGRSFFILEWFFTGAFTLEYLLRIYLAHRPKVYIFSFYGIIDLLAVLPSYLELFLVGPHYLMVIRILRMLRLFRIFKLTRYIRAEENIRKALKASKAKIVVFFASVLVIVTIIGAFMYLIEGPQHGFKNIPVSVYWAINTMTPVSEGDLQAETAMGQAFAAFLMFMGYALLAIPSGIVSSEITRASLHQQQERLCPSCGRSGHENIAEHCKFCGAELPETPGTKKA